MPSFIGQACRSTSFVVAPVTEAALVRSELHALLGADLRGKRVAFWGLVPAGHVGRLNDSSVVEVIESLLAEGGAVSAHDPQWGDDARALFADRVLLFDDPYLAAMDADVLLLSGERGLYREPQLDLLLAVMAAPVILDREGRWAGLELAGFEYRGFLGRGYGARAARDGETRRPPGATVHA
jgi:UDPglucose 6-dehydrogenase